MIKNYTTRSPTKARYRPKSLSPMTAHQDVSFSGKSEMTAYVLPKLRTQELYSESGSPKPVIEQKYSLIQQISQLERQHRADKIRIDLLEKQISELEAQIENYKKLNKNLLEEKGPAVGGVHALYHDLFITDLKQQMSELNGEVGVYKNIAQVSKMEIDTVRKENLKLNATLRRYRKLLSESIQKSEITEQADSSSVVSMLASDKDSHRHVGSRNLNTTLDPSKTTLNGLKNNLVSLSKLDRLSQAMNQITKCEDLMSICKVFAKSAKALTKSEKITIFVISQKAKNDYVKSFGHSADFIGRVRLGNT